jgi:hypothetical protein
MTEHTQYSPREERHWFLWSWLALVVIYNLFTIVSFLTGGSNPLAYIVTQENANTAAILIVNIASALAIVFCVLTAIGLKIGYYGLVLSYIVMAIASLVIGFNIGIVLAAVLVALITWVLLRPAWGRMT